MSVPFITVQGAAGHNLKHIDVQIPRNALTVITGVSGSGKSTLAFDTLFAEGQRRYVESLSAYARQFLDQIQKPVVERIDGLSPAIAIEQRSGGNNPRSIVATTTEVYDFIRLLYANAGQPHCPKCDRELERFTAESIVERLMALPEGTRVMLLAPQDMVTGQSRSKRMAEIRRRGYLRVRIGGEILDVESEPAVAAGTELEIVVDRLVVRGDDLRSRFTDSVELALQEGNGRLVAMTQLPDAGAWLESGYSEQLRCEDCGVAFDVLTSRHFSFNSPYGACPRCDGLGTEMVFDEGLLVPDDSVALDKGAIPAWRQGGRALILYYRRQIKGLMKHYDIAPGTCIRDLSADVRKVLLYGSADVVMHFTGRKGGRAKEQPFEGVIPNLKRRYRETTSESVRQRLRRFMTRQRCPACQGGRLRPESAACRFHGVSPVALLAMPIEKALAFFDELSLAGQELEVCGELVREIRERLGFMQEVGLGYLTLDRQSSTLSGGEGQRLRLATQMGASLTGVLYVLDEPTIGLHEHDNARLITILKRLRDAGNTVVVVEHDEMMIRAADHVIDLGMGAGDHGGEVVFSGTVDELVAAEESLTAAFLRGEESRIHPVERHAPGAGWIEVRGARLHNLQGVDVNIPLGQLVVVSGVSGSGKSTLVNDIIGMGVAARVGRGGRATVDLRGCDEVEGLDNLDKLIVIDQSPIGRTPRSNPATYTGAFDPIRQLFAATTAAKIRGYSAGRFSFNVKGGRCEACKGDGQLRLEMHFLPDVYVRCERCAGLRYNRETLEVTYGGRNIAEVLAMTVEEACAFFGAIPSVARRLQGLVDVGLGYVQLGQAAPTLSGGEAQRVKLASELSRVATGRTLYLLDEPTTGLHFADVRQLMAVLFRLRDAGNSVLMIEHNLDVIAAADYVIDMGPGGGEHGGAVIAAGAPALIRANAQSLTGRYLRACN